jgi:[LSU ribosomal protein L11P]-lysine N-methyltransferase (EC 2.1.1.-)
MFAEFQILLPADALDAWTDALLAAGALSVSVEDDDRDTPDESALYGEPGEEPPDSAWRNNRVSVLVDRDADIGDLLAIAARDLDAAPPAAIACKTVDDCDWVRQTQAQFAPIAVGRIWIVPSWHTPPDPQAINIRIDPGAAFGTGAHPTTRLCLQWMERNPPTGRSVLDYGCGSGILSICAAALGAAEVVGVDIDPAAIATARHNAQENRVTVRYTAPEAFAEEPERRFDLVIANILANPIMVLAPMLAHRVRPGGTILLSGILERQAQAIIDTFLRADPRMTLAVVAQDEGWVAIAGTKPSDDPLRNPNP